MCTVTFLPMGTNDYVLTSNRDENPVRKQAIQPEVYKLENALVVFPKDMQAEGTWIATSGNQFTCCLLNGAFEKHQRKESYKKSRGLVLLDFFRYNDIDKYVHGYDFTGIEPFTLLILDGRKKIRICELRWDGDRLFVTEVDATKPHIWSSVTLYSEDTIHQREKWFRDFLCNHPDYYGYSILDFHHLAGGNDQANSLVMNRNEKIKTVSITSIEKKDFQLQMTYQDVINRKISSTRIN